VLQGFAASTLKHYKCAVLDPKGLLFVSQSLPLRLGLPASLALRFVTNRYALRQSGSLDERGTYIGFLGSEVRAYSLLLLSLYVANKQNIKEVLYV